MGENLRKSSVFHCEKRNTELTLEQCLNDFCDADCLAYLTKSPCHDCPQGRNNRQSFSGISEPSRGDPPKSKKDKSRKEPESAQPVAVPVATTSLEKEQTQPPE